MRKVKESKQRMQSPQGLGRIDLNDDSLYLLNLPMSKDFRMAVCPVTSILAGPRKVIDFHVVEHFSHYKTGRDYFQAL